MILELIRNLGVWSWLIFGIVLLVAELLLPGNFLVWVGIAGIITGGLSLLFADSSWWIWQSQWIVFAVLSMISVFIGRRWLVRSNAASDEPTLNQRSASLIGRTANLIDPIVNGHGRVKIGDTVWMVNGPDLPVGAKVRVIGGHGSDLRVEAMQ